MDRNICVNQIYRDVRSDHQFRLLWVDPTATGTYIYWLNGKASIPKKFSLTELENGISQGWIVEEQDPFVLHGEPSERDQAFRDAIWSKMKTALLDEPGISTEIFGQSICTELRKKAEKRCGICTGI